MTGSWGPASEPDAPRAGVCDRRGPYQEFARRIRARHYWVLGTPLCACTQPAALCPDLRDAHELFGDHMPSDPADTTPLRPPTPVSLPARRPSPHPAPLRPPHPPRPYRGEL